MTFDRCGCSGIGAYRWRCVRLRLCIVTAAYTCACAVSACGWVWECSERAPDAPIYVSVSDRPESVWREFRFFLSQIR